MSDLALLHIQLDDWKNLPFENPIESSLKGSLPEVTYFHLNNDSTEGLMHYCKELVKKSSFVYVFFDCQEQPDTLSIRKYLNLLSRNKSKVKVIVNFNIDDQESTLNSFQPVQISDSTELIDWLKTREV